MKLQKMPKNLWGKMLFITDDMILGFKKLFFISCFLWQSTYKWHHLLPCGKPFLFSTFSDEIRPSHVLEASAMIWWKNRNIVQKINIYRLFEKKWMENTSIILLYFKFFSISPLRSHLGHSLLTRKEFGIGKHDDVPLYYIFQAYTS